MVLEQGLKQRLVGVVVITSLAAIFVPMLFDDPIDKTGKMISELKIPDQPIKLFDTEAISLPKNTDDVMKLPEPLALKEVAKVPLHKAEMERWFIQAGMFGQKSNATALQNQLRQQGFPATISKVASGNGVLYRVRVGPELVKKRAEAMKDKLNSLNHIKAILTSVDE